MYFSTPQALPSAPPNNVTIIQFENGVNVSWEPSDWLYWGGPLLSFNITARKIDNQPIADPSKPSVINYMEQFYTGYTSYSVFFKLPEQGVKYEFLLCAIDSVGAGPWSNAVIESTLDGGSVLL